MAETIKTLKGFIKDYNNNRLLPITRAELVLDANGYMALHSSQFEAAVPDPSNSEDEGKWGLISPEDLALVRTLKGGAAGNGTIATIQQQLAALYSNLGLKVGETSVKFYDSQNTFSGITLKGDNNIIVRTTADNIIQFVLNQVATTKTGSGVITDIITDKYGRVVSITGSSSLSRLSLQNSTVTMSEDDASIANKKYVDDKFNTANNTALGSLKFGGVIPNQTELDNIGETSTSNVNSYFKIGKDNLELKSQYILGGTSNIILKAGDTVIVHTNNEGTGFVYIPSGDEPITTLTIQDEFNGKVENAVGAVTLRFAPPFIVTNQSDTTAIISLPYLGSDLTAEYGLLSREEYNKFMQYSAKSMSYTAMVTSTSPDSYTLGQISFGEGAGTPIYGQNTTYTLGLNNGYTEGPNVAKDPKLTFTPSSGETAEIQFKGTTGLEITKSDNNIQFTPKITSTTTDYLTADGSRVGVVMGKVENGQIVNGLIDYSTAFSFANQVHQTSVKFEEITLNYGSDLKFDI